MEQVFIFDVDGTLTAPRRAMNVGFSRFFKKLVGESPVYLVTGSDLPKLEDQLPKWVLKNVAGVFTCSGNELWTAGKPVFKQEHKFPDAMIEFVEELLGQSAYLTRTGRHVEIRTGTLNISVVGRNATMEQRLAYNQFDAESGERHRISAFIEAAFPEYEAYQGGQISIDVSLKGWNKSRIFTYVERGHPDARFCFFGDNIRHGGNDLPLADAISQADSSNQVFPVSDYMETWQILKNLQSSKTSSEPIPLFA